MHILLVEPNRARRQQLVLLLTTTGGYQVSAVSSFSEAFRHQQADLLMVSQRLYQPSVSMPCILFDAYQQTDSAPAVIGCISPQTADIAIPEKVRTLWENHSAL